MSQIEKESALRKEAVEKSTAAVEKLNDKSESNAKLLKLFAKWESEDSEESTDTDSEKKLDQ